MTAGEEIKAKVVDMAAGIQSAHGIAVVLREQVTELRFDTESIGNEFASKSNWSDDREALIALQDMHNARGAMYEAMRHAQALSGLLEGARAYLRKAQKGIK